MQGQPRSKGFSPPRALGQAVPLLAAKSPGDEVDARAGVIKYFSFGGIFSIQILHLRMLENVSPRVYNFKNFWESMPADPPWGQRSSGVATPTYRNATSTFKSCETTVETQ